VLPARTPEVPSRSRSTGYENRGMRLSNWGAVGRPMISASAIAGPHHRPGMPPAGESISASPVAPATLPADRQSGRRTTRGHILLRKRHLRGRTISKCYPFRYDFGRVPVVSLRNTKASFESPPFEESSACAAIIPGCLRPPPIWSDGLGIPRTIVGCDTPPALEALADGLVPTGKKKEESDGEK